MLALVGDRVVVTVTCHNKNGHQSTHTPGIQREERRRRNVGHHEDITHSEGSPSPVHKCMSLPRQPGTELGHKGRPRRKTLYHRDRRPPAAMPHWLGYNDIETFRDAARRPNDTMLHATNKGSVLPDMNEPVTVTKN